jgi:hypothetical protein
MFLLSAAALLLTSGCTPKPGEELHAGEWFSGPSGPKIVAMATDETDADRRREGIALLSNHDWGRSEPYLKWYAQRLEVDKDPGVRCVAARALAKVGAVQYLPNVVAALRDPVPAVRMDVAVALERLLGDAAIDPLCKTAAEDGSPDVRAAAAKALRHYPQMKVVRALVYCLSDQSFEVRHWSHESLVQIVGKDMGTEPKDWAPVAGADVPLHGPQWQRPWWDWFGTTKPREPAAPAASQPTGAGKPWWDWAGVTRSGAPTTQPTSAPAAVPTK